LSDVEPVRDHINILFQLIKGPVEWMSGAVLLEHLAERPADFVESTDKTQLIGICTAAALI
jgi:hypothetical protein